MCFDLFEAADAVSYQLVRLPLSQRVPARVEYRFGAVALRFVLVDAALGADPLAVVSTKSPHGEPKSDLLANGVRQLQPRLLIKPDICVVARDRSLLRARNHRPRVKIQFKRTFDRLLDGPQAARALRSDFALNTTADANRSRAVLVQQLRRAFGTEFFREFPIVGKTEFAGQERGVEFKLAKLQLVDVDEQASGHFELP